MASGVPQHLGEHVAERYNNTARRARSITDRINYLRYGYRRPGAEDTAELDALLEDALREFVDDILPRPEEPKNFSPVALRQWRRVADDPAGRANLVSSQLRSLKTENQDLRKQVRKLQRRLRDDGQGQGVR